MLIGDLYDGREIAGGKRVMLKQCALGSLDPKKVAPPARPSSPHPHPRRSHPIPTRVSAQAMPVAWAAKLLSVADREYTDDAGMPVAVPLIPLRCRPEVDHRGNR